MRADGIPDAQINALVSDLKAKGKIDESSGLERVVKGAIKPFTDFGRTAVALGTAGTGLVQGLAGDKQSAMQSARKAMSVLTPEQQEAYTGTGADAMTEGLKMGAGLSSYAVPAGKTFKSAVGLGGLAGGLRGAYDAEGGIEDTLGSIGAGAVGGGIAGGTFYGAGKLLSKAKSSSALRNVNPKVASGPTSITDERQLQQIADDLDLKGTPTQKREQIAKLMKDYSDEITDILKTSKSSRKYRGVVNEIKRNIMNSGEYYTGTSAQQKALDVQLKLLERKATDGVLTAKDLYEFKKAIPVDKAFKTLQKGGEVTVEKQQVALDIWNSIDDILTRMAPEVKEQTLNQSRLYKLAPGLEELSRESLRGPLGIPVGTNLIRGGMDVAGRAGQGIAGIERGIGGVISNPAVQAVGQPAFRQVGSMMATGSIPQEEPIDTGNIDMEFENQGMVQGTQQPQMPQPQMQMPQMPQQPQNIFGGKSKEEVLQGAAQAGANLNDLQQLSAYYDMLVPQQQGMGVNMVQQAISSGMSKQQLLQSAASMGADMAQLKEISGAYDMLSPEDKAGGFDSISPKLDELIKMHSQLPATGFVGGRTVGLSRALGNVPAAAYESASSSLAVEIAAAMGLKPLSEAEVAEVRKKWLPSPIDTPEQAQGKIRALKTLLKSGQKVNLVQTSPEDL